MSENNHQSIFYKIELSAIATVIGIIILFSGAVSVTLIAPSYVDPEWTRPASAYQVQMYEVSDPNIYFSSLRKGSPTLQSVYHLKDEYSLISFRETETVRFVAPPDLEKYITRQTDPTLKLTSRLILLRIPQPSQNMSNFDGTTAAEKLRTETQTKWEKEHPDWKEKNLDIPSFDILELFTPETKEAFAIAPTDRILEDWVDSNYQILDSEVKQTWHGDRGVIFINNPREYRVTFFKFANQEEWRYDPSGTPIKSVQELLEHPLGFRSRKELISYGEHLYAIEGCWYCHTDQTRTLVQDVVLNGSESYPAPPSSPNEYIYQHITFPGTRRIGPDISRVGVKRPSRDWHQSHFWSPKTASIGTIMPAFKHFFDYDPRGTGTKISGIPNFKFEAIFQYLMTKGTRITAPNEAWWLGKDPIKTKEIIERSNTLD